MSASPPTESAWVPSQELAPEAKHSSGDSGKRATRPRYSSIPCCAVRLGTWCQGKMLGEKGVTWGPDRRPARRPITATRTEQEEG